MSEKLIAVLSSEEIRPIAKSVTRNLKRLKGGGLYQHIPVDSRRFASGEIKPKIPMTIRGKRVFVFHSPFHPDPNTGLMSLFLTLNAVHLASADEIIVVVPFLPYLRQDRKDEPRVPISAKVVANLIQSSPRVRRIVTMDMHVEQEEGFFNIPVDNLWGRKLHEAYFRTLWHGDFRKVLVVAPDFGASVRAKRFASLLTVKGEPAPVGILEKVRSRGSTDIESHRYIGPDPAGLDVIVYDDMTDTGGTHISAAKEMLSRKARSVRVCVTHGIFSHDGKQSAEEKFGAAGIKVVTTTSIPRSGEYYHTNRSWLTALPIDELLTKVLFESNRRDGSVSALR